VIRLNPDAVQAEPEPPKQKKRGNRRGSVSSESFNANAKVDMSTAPVIPKTPEQTATITAIVSTNILFSSLDKPSKKTVVDAMSEKVCAPGEVVIKQGADGDFYYVVASGAFDCFVKMGDDADGEHDGEHGTKVVEYVAGTAFGELALMYNASRAATVVCREGGVLWALDRETFRKLILQSMVWKRERLETALMQVPLLKSLNPFEIGGLVDICEDCYFSSGDIAIAEGDSGSNLYILLSGTAIATQVKASGEKVIVMEYAAGSYFGELAALGHGGGT